MSGEKLPSARRAAVFLDRDGVVNASPGDHDYVRSADEFVMLCGVPEAVRLLNDAGLPVIVISNQRGVARGLMTYEDLKAITRRMQEEMSLAGARVDRAYYCTHDNNSCNCRKPLPGLFYQARDELGVDLQKSYFIGDTQTDIIAGRAAGCKTFLVLTGKNGAGQLGTLDPQPDFVAKDLAEAARKILSMASE